MRTYTLFPRVYTETVIRITHLNYTIYNIMSLASGSMDKVYKITRQKKKAEKKT